MERKTEAAKKSWEASRSAPKCYQSADPTIVHYTETSFEGSDTLSFSKSSGVPYENILQMVEINKWITN